MKVLHIFNELKFSGAEIMYVDAAPIFKEWGCVLTAMATSKDLGEYAPHFKQAGYKVLHKPYPKLINYFDRIVYYIALIQLLKKEKYDVVHIHRSNAMWGGSFCAWVAGIKSVYTFHNVFSTHPLTKNYHRLLRWSAKYIFKCRFQSISDSVYQNEISYFLNKTKKINNWYGANRFYSASKEEKAKAREELNIRSDAFVLISIGGCSDVKRHSDIIKALPSILEQESNSLYLHLGEGCTEVDEKKLVKELNITENVRFFGNQTDVRKFLIASDIYLMTSKYEGIPITTIEALACGIPAVLYDVPGLRDFNNDGENCLLIPENDSLLAKEILFLRKNNKVAKKLSKNGQQMVHEYFSMNKNVKEVCKLYCQ